MVHQSRRRKYKTRRERLAESLKNIKLIAIFAVIAFAGYLWFNRIFIRDWIQIYFGE